MTQRLNKVFGGRTLQPGHREESMAVADWVPVVDVAETESEFEVLIELPVLRKTASNSRSSFGHDSVTGRPSVGQTMLHGIARQFHVAFQTELFQYARTVRADRIGAHVQLPRDDLEGLPCGQQAQDLKLSV